MSNETVVRLVADASGYTSEMDRARKSAADFMNSQDTMRQRLTNSVAAIDASRKALKDQGDAAVDAFNKSAKNAEKWLTSLQKQADQAGKTRAQLMELRAAELGISDAAQPYIDKIKSAETAMRSGGHAAGEFGFATAGAKRELLVLAHEMSQGNWTRFGGSLMVLGERTNAMSLIFNKTALGIGAVLAVVTLAAEQVYKATEAMAEYGDSIEKLHQKTGLSTDSIQQWSFATKTVGIDTKDATKMLTDLGEAQNKAISGNKDAAKAFAAIGLSINELKNNNPDQLLPKIADAFANSADSASKAAVANELFGASGADLIPLLDRGRAGLDELRQAAQESGAVIGGDTVGQMAALKEQMELSKAKMDAVSLSAKAQLLPAIIALNDALGNNVSMKPLIEDFYSAMGFVLKTTASAVAVLTVGVMQTAVTINSLVNVTYYAVTGQLKKAADEGSWLFDKLKAQGAGYSEFMKKLWADTVPQDHKKQEAQGPKLKFAPGVNHAQKPYQDDAATKYLQQLRDQDAALRAELGSTQKLTGAQKELAEFQQKLNDWKGKSNLTAEQKSLMAAQDKIKAQLAINIEHEKEKKHLEEINKLQERSAQINAQIANVQASHREQYSIQLGAIGLGSEAQKNAEAVKSIYAEYQKLQWQLEKETPKNLIGSDKYNAEKEQIQAGLQQSLKDYDAYYSELKAKQEDWHNGATAAMANYVDSAHNMMTQMGSLFSTVFNGLESTMLNFFNTGKIGWKEFASAVLVQIEKILIAEQIAGLVGTVGSYYAAGGSSGISAGQSMMEQNASTISVAGARASGGPVASGSTYLVGENGPELFTPSSSGSIIPNHALGGSAAGVAISQTFYIQQDGTVKKTGSAGQLEQITQQMADAMTTIAKQSIVKAMMPGGEISSVYGARL